MFDTIESLDQFFEARKRLGIKPGLTRMERLLTSVDQPHTNHPFIHVAGTNGKGSTVTYLAAILKEAGYNVGTFTSPSLTNRQAMIQLNGEPISDQAYLTYVNKLSDTINILDKEDNPASLFEIIVAIAFQFFKDHTDIAVIETGMGGLEDATNLLEPLVSVITTVGYDHTTFLGNTIEEITRHKAGVIKPKRPVVIGQMEDRASKIIKQVALDQKAPLDQLGESFHVIWIENRPYYKEKDQVIPLRLRLLGAHQFLNTAVAIKTISVLNQQNYMVTTEQIKIGIRQAHLPARFEQISDHPLIIIDGAHNYESIEAFIEAVNKYYHGVYKNLIFAAFEDKPIKKMLSLLEPHFEKVVLTTFDSDRAESAERLYEQTNHPNKQQINDWQKYIEEIKKDKTSKKATFVVGSLDFVGSVREYFE